MSCKSLFGLIHTDPRSKHKQRLYRPRVSPGETLDRDRAIKRQTLSPNFTPKSLVNGLTNTIYTAPIAGKFAWRYGSVNQNAIKHTLMLRTWESENLPLFKHSVSQAVVLRLVEAFVADTPLSVKELTLSLPYSSSGIRLQLRMLENSGWIRFSPSSDDQRVKVIQPSEMFNHLLEGYAGRCLALTNLT